MLSTPAAILLVNPPAVTLARFTGSAEDIAREGWGLLRALGVPAQDIRGMGIQVGCCAVHIPLHASELLVGCALACCLLPRL